MLEVKEKGRATAGVEFAELFRGVCRSDGSFLHVTLVGAYDKYPESGTRQRHAAATVTW